MLFWALGFAVGFMLWPKIRPYLHKIYVVPWFWPSVAAITIGIGLGVGKGCSSDSFDSMSLRELLRALLPHQVKVAASSPRTFTPIAANAQLDEVLKELKVRRHQDELREQKQLRLQVRAEAAIAMAQPPYPSFVMHGSRKGPFCHLTCTVHHGTAAQHVWDAETLPEFCRANYLPPAARFPAWETQSIGAFNGSSLVEEQIDVLHDYCGPIPSKDCEADGEKHPLQSYKLYWKN